MNKTAKDQLKQSFHKWYADQVKQQLKANKSPDEVSVDLRLSIVKEVGAKWITAMYDYLQSHPDICRNGFTKVGITDAICHS